MNKVKFYEKYIEICREVLAKEKIGSHYFNNILLMIFALFDMKPVSSFGVKVKDLDKFEGYIKNLGLEYMTFPANPDGYSEIVVSKSMENINKYISIDKASFKDMSERAVSFGKIFGYTDTAIRAMAKSIDRPEPIQFLVDICSNKNIPRELVIVYTVFDMIPASRGDNESIELGAKIIILLDEIDPSISTYYLKLGQKELRQSARVILGNLLKMQKSK